MDGGQFFGAPSRMVGQDFGAHGRQPNQPPEGLWDGVLGVGEWRGGRVALELQRGKLHAPQHS